MMGRRYPWDAFGYHLYIDQGGATSSAHLAQYLDAVRALQTQQSDSSPVWITEFGWQSPRAVSDAQQASNLDTALTLFEARADVGRTFVFMVDDYDDWGLFDSRWNSKPAVAVYRQHDKGCAHLPLTPQDAGAPDAATGAGAPDAARADAAGADASGGAGGCATEQDAAAEGGDRGAGSGGAGSSGCGCRAATGRSGPGAALALASLAGLVARRRRRHDAGR